MPVLELSSQKHGAEIRKPEKFNRNVFASPLPMTRLAFREKAQNKARTSLTSKKPPKSNLRGL